MINLKDTIKYKEGQKIVFCNGRRSGKTVLSLIALERARRTVGLSEDEQKRYDQLNSYFKKIGITNNGA